MARTNFSSPRATVIQESGYQGKNGDRKGEVGWFSLTTGKPFEAVVAALKSGGRATDIVDFYTLVDNVFTPPIGPETLRQYGGGADVSPLWLPFRLDGRQLEELVSLRQHD
jgi:hypothetical protein